MGKGEKLIVVNQAITHHKKINLEYIHTCSFKGNLQSESATIQNTASGERKQCDHYWPSTTHHTKFNPDVCTSMSIQRQLTHWVWDNAPVHSTASEERRNQCDHYWPIYHSSHKTQSWGCTNMFILRNLPTESSMVHSIASGKKMWLCMCNWPGYHHTSHKIQPQVHTNNLKVTYSLGMHQCTVQEVGKEGKMWL